MDVNESAGAASAPTPHHEGHHRSARERQRKGPMWGCLRVIFFGGIGLTLLLFLVIGGSWWYLGTSNFAGLVLLRIQDTLKNRLGRDVSIRSVEIVRGREAKIIINDLRIANAPGGIHPYFATVKQIVVSGGIDSFWGRKVTIGRVDVTEPHLYFEIYPAGSPLVHNFPHWQTGPRGKREIVHLDLSKMFVTGGELDFLDRKHDIAANASGLDSQIDVTLAEDVYRGTAASPLVRVRIQDYQPFDLDLRGAFRYSPNVLDLEPMALNGRNMKIFLSGRVAPLADGVYNLHLTSELGLDRVREIFKVQKRLEGTVALDGMLRGKQGEFTLDGKWISPKLRADAYEIAAIKGRMHVTGDGSVVDIDTGKYGGGTVSAHYVLPKYAEPYPMSAELRYNGVSLEKLFADWGENDTGLRGAATGKLSYHWNKDKVLEGGGEGTATLAKTTTAFSNAKYPIPLGGSADFALNNGVVTFRKAALETAASKIAFSGTLRIDDLFTDLKLYVDSNDFGELDRAGYNFAHAAGKKTYTLLGLGGAGTINGSVHGKLKEPEVVAHIAGKSTKYNDILLGDSDIDLKYDGVKSVLTFERAAFRDGNGKLALTGTVAFPTKGPSPRFDLAIDAEDYPIDRALATMSLKMVAKGLGTGKLVVTGTPDEGKVTFANLTIRQPNAQLTLEGDVQWFPGKGNSVFNLDIAARNYPVADIVAFLELGSFPVTGDLTGTLHLEGPKTKLEGAGAVTVRNGSIYGEPVTQVTTDLAFTKGTLKATNVTVTAPAGTITGQAELDLNTNRYSYSIQSASLDVSKFKLLSSLAGILGGKIKISSTGAGTFEQPELVLEATLNEATMKGLTLPPDAPPPQLYIAIRNGQLIVRGSAANVLTIEGEGTVAQDGALDGLVKIKISDVAKALALSTQTATIPASGRMEFDLKLGGKLGSLESIRIDGTAPDFDLKLADDEFVPVRPLRFGLREGRFVFDDFELGRVGQSGSGLSVAGYAELTGAKRLNIDVRGVLEAALLQLFVTDLRADGHINLAGGVHGTLGDPRITGTAELQNAQFRFAGFPQLIDGVTGTLVFKSDRIEIDSLRANVGGGTIVAGGYVTTEGLTPKRIRITLQGNDVVVRYFQGVTVEGDFNLLLAGDIAQRFTLQGDVNVNRALYYKDFDFKQSLLNLVLSRRGVTPVVAAGWQDRVGLQLHLAAPQTLAVRNNIADVTGSADLDVTGTLANPVVLGVVSLDEGGKVRFQNIDYRVVRGSITFQNPFRIDPYFDITVEGRVSGGFSDSDTDTGPVDVTVNLSGTLDRLTPSITSDPPASDITLFSLLGLGNIGNIGSKGDTTQNTSAGLYGRSFLYQSVGNFLGSKLLPFADAFTVDPGLLDASVDPGVKVTFEKRISNDVRVLVVYNLHSAKNRELIEWQVTPEWTMQFTRDEIRSEYRLEGRFRRRYEGHWAFGRLGRPSDVVLASLGSITPTSVGAAALSKALARGDEPPPPPGAPIIQSIDFRADAPFDTTTLSQYIGFKPGDPLTIRATQTAIKSLVATGDFRDVRVESVPAGTGVALTFVLSLNYRVGTITFDGLHGTERERATHELTVRNGDVLSLNSVDRSATAVQTFLSRDGYLQATVDPETTFVRNASRADVIFHVTTGQHATIAAVDIQGNTAPFSPSELIAQMKHGPGKSFNIADARAGATDIRRYVIRRDYRKADVRFLKYDYDPATAHVTLHYHVTVGPIVRVEVEGVPRHDVRGLLPFLKNQPYSEDIIDRYAGQIVTAYQERGYFNAAVDTESNLKNNVWTTTFHIKPGQQYHLTAVTFSGAQKIPPKELAPVVATSPTGGFTSFMAKLFRRPQGVTREQLGTDRDALESFYRLHGFSDVKIATPVAEAKPVGTLTVDFPITEGPQTIVREVHVEGNEQVAANDLPKLQLKPGDPLNPQVVQDDRVALEMFYGQRGNAEAQVSVRPEISDDHTSAKIAYVIAEGPKIRIDDVIVRGNSYTNTKVILKKAELKRGDPFSYTSILQAQQNLYRLGVFQRVDIQPEQIGTSLSDRNVVIQVEEGKDLTVAGSAGITSGMERSDHKLSPLGSISVANRDLFGTGRYAGLEVVVSRERRDAFLTYREPFIFGWNVPLQMTIFQSDDVRRGAQIRQRGTFLEASKVAGLQTRWSVRYEYKISDCRKGDLCTQIQDAIIPGLDRSLLNIRISSITPTFFWDKRDDAVDPHRGFFTTASVEYAFRAFAADAHFLKEFTQASYYLPVSGRSVFAVSARVGLIQPIGGVAVPLSERFTAGGDTTHRAFPLDLLGTLCDPADTQCKGTLVRPDPNGSILPVGGNGLLLINGEYRFPIFSSLGGAVFADAGQVYRDSALNLGELRYGIGTGVRYLSAVGPIRFDVGYKLNKKSYEKPFAYFITLGYAF